MPDAGRVPKPQPQLRAAYRSLPPLLRELREQAELTQRQLAERLGVAQNTIHRLEIGSRRCDAIELIDWCRACGAEPKKVFDRLVSATASRGRSQG